MVRKATAQDVADLAGVSRSAVSLVLNGRAEGHIARDKQQAIIDAARQLNYTPNAVAVSLRNRRTRTIGVLTWSSPGGFSVPMLHATLKTTTAAGYLSIFMDTANDRDHQSQALATLRDRQVDALLVIAPDLIDYRPAEVMWTIPTTLVNCLDPSGGLTSVVADEHGAGSAAAGVLIEAGHTSLGVIAGPSDSMQSRLRLEGIEAVAAANRIGVSVQAVPNRDIDSGFAAASTLLSASEAPTALICSHERLAVGAVLAAANLGVAIPADLSLVSMDDGEQLASRLVPQLTTIERPDRAMAEQAVTVTLQAVDEENGGEIRQLTLDCSPAIRDSVARPRRPNRRPCLPADR